MGLVILTNPSQFVTLLFVIMSPSIALSLLRQGNTGDQILHILDTLVNEITEENISDFVQHAVALNTPTLEEIAF